MGDFDYRTFFTVAYRSLFRWKEISAPFTLKRALFLVAFFAIFPMFELLNALCLFLDNVFFPVYRRSEIIAPIFIVGNPRSGTTLLHRIMARDEKHFFYFKTWEIVFPAIIQKKVLAIVGYFDNLIGGPLGKLVRKIESRSMREFSSMHKTGMFLPEEDDKLLVHIFSSPDLVFFFPTPHLDWLRFFDQKGEKRNRERILSFYTKCIKRQAFFKGDGKHLLSKSPNATSRIRSLFEQFPDCKIVYLVRSPLEVIPSIVNMTHHILRSTIALEDGYPFQEQVYETIRYFYEYPLRILQEYPEDSYAIVNYEDLVHKPSSVVRCLFRRFGLALTPDFESALLEEDQRAAAYISKHSYTLDHLRIPLGRIVSELKPVFDRFGFDTTGNPENKGKPDGVS